MKIGFINTYPFRPHSEHLVYLAELVTKAGGTALFANCDGSVPTCYYRQLKPSLPKFMICRVCRYSGLYSFTNEKVKGLGKKGKPGILKDKDLYIYDRSAAFSSFFTLHRSESPSDLDQAWTDELSHVLATAMAQYRAAVRQWICTNKIDAIIGFNGRMDLMKAVRLACADENIHFITVERPWFGSGLLLVPDQGPNGTRCLDKLVKEYANSSLTRSQIVRALLPLAKRIARISLGEFRQYNKGHVFMDWNVTEGKRRVLFIPSSRSEWVGEEEEVEGGWQHPLFGIQELLDKGIVDPEELIVRFHPIWAQDDVSNVEGSHISNYFRDFCKRTNLRYIESDEKADTFSLINQADVILLNGSSAFFEASVIGKPILSLSPSFYDSADVVINFHSPRDISAAQNLFTNYRELDKSVSIRKALRFSYTLQYRYHQFINDTVHLTPFKPRFVFEADGHKLLRLCQTGIIEADDTTVAVDTIEEDHYIQDLTSGNVDWKCIVNEIEPAIEGKKIERKSWTKIFDLKK